MKNRQHSQPLVLALTVWLLPQLAAGVPQPPDAEPGARKTQQTRTAPDPAPNSEAQQGFQVEIQQIRTQSRTSLDALRGQVELRLKVSNVGQNPGVLSQSQWMFSCNGKSAQVNPAIQDPLLDSTNRTLKPGESHEGWVAFVVQHASASEPLMLLTWKHEEASVTVDVNAAMRKTSAVQLKFLGPDDCLAVIQLERPLDQIAVWLLTREFQFIRKRSVERVVLDLRPGEEKGPRTYTLRRALETWLMSVQRGAELHRFPFRSYVKSPVQFEHFYVSNMRSYALNSRSTGSYGTQVNIYRKDREHAVADALRSIYERSAVEDALADLMNPEPGIQRAVVESCLDRLTGEQLNTLLKNADRRSSEHQAMVAENLYRVSMPAGTDALSAMAEDSDADVSYAALKSLVRSVNPKAADILKKLWRGSESQSVHQDIVNAIMEARDHRHLDLLTEFAEKFVARFSEESHSLTEASGEASPDAPDRENETATSSERSRNSVRQPNIPSPPTRILQDVLRFLRDQDEDGFAIAARRKLMKITDPGVQDVVMNHILARSSAADERLVRQYIGQRLPPEDSGDGLSEEERTRLNRKFGARSSTGSIRISDTLMKTIRKYPSSDYTDRLVDLSKSSAVSSSLRPQIFQVAVRCATDEQLTGIIERFPSLDTSAKAYLLNQLSVMQHPEWLPLTRQCLRADDSVLNIALGSLRSNGSAQATQAIVDVLEELRIQAEQSGQAAPRNGQQKKEESDRPGAPSRSSIFRPGYPVPPARSVNADNRLKRIIPLLATSTYPEARRAINRCNRSGKKNISDLAFQAILSFHRANPHRADVSKAYELRRKKDYDGALLQYNRILETDPFYSSGYVSRASLRLRSGHPESAMADLKTAEKLDPENPLIESLVALTEIRLGNVEKGLQQSEKILRSIPDLKTMVRRDTIYNTACAYGRAAEAAESDSRRDAYLAKGMEMLRASVDREPGFDDVQHAKDDPDLNAFHSHPQWNDLLARIAENEEKKAKP